MTRPGYDVLADRYAETFPDAYSTTLERHAVYAFVDTIRASGRTGPVVDVGCGLGHVAADLAEHGIDVVGVEPSAGMLELAKSAHPDLRLIRGDALLDGVDLGAASGILARYSLIHLPPDEVSTVLHDWSTRLRPGTPVLLAGQARDAPGVQEFDHAVTRAWRWHPSTLAEAMRDAGLTELWRTVSRPDETHRFPDYHLLAVASGSG
ncbi:class I SAM-dependent methyltransferase [Tsukamurella soli]|uniref:Class I SAM-dependent methyltransferase n=1 Tax=Tsukamurella soli TaxID=644556 RepID=A0ABP8J844_9ACTN